MLTGQYTEIYVPEQNGVRYIAVDDNVDTIKGFELPRSKILSMNARPTDQQKGQGCLHTSLPMEHVSEPMLRWATVKTRKSKTS